MSLTRLDCNFFRGSKAEPHSSSFVSFNPTISPGSLVVAGATTTGTGVASSVLSKLALDHFTEGVLEFFSDRPEEPFRKTLVQRDGREAVCNEALRAAFMGANQATYDFISSLEGAEDVSTELIGLIVEESVVAAGRIGRASTYLWRDAELFPFFPESDEQSDRDFALGVAGEIAVQLSTVPLEAEDLIVLLPEELPSTSEEMISKNLKTANIEELETEEILNRVCRSASKIPFSMFARLGPETVYLKEVL